MQSFGDQVRQHGLIGHIHARPNTVTSHSFTKKVFIALALAGAAFGATVDFQRSTFTSSGSSNIEMKAAQSPTDIERPAITPANHATAEHAESKRTVDPLQAFIAEKEAEIAREHRQAAANLKQQANERVRLLQSVLTNPCELRESQGVFCRSKGISRAAEPQPATSQAGMMNVVEMGAENGTPIYLGVTEGFGSATVFLKDGSAAIVLDKALLDEISFEYAEPAERAAVTKFIITQQVLRLKLELRNSTDDLRVASHDQTADIEAIDYFIANGMPRNDARMVAMQSLQTISNFLQSPKSNVHKEDKHALFLVMAGRMANIDEVFQADKSSNKPPSLT